MARRDPWYRQAADLVLEGSEMNGALRRGAGLGRPVSGCAVTAANPYPLRMSLAYGRSRPAGALHWRDQARCAERGLTLQWASDVLSCRRTGDPISKEELTAAVVKWYGEVNAEASITARKARGACGRCSVPRACALLSSLPSGNRRRD